MMYDLNSDEQREQLIKVLGYLKSKNIKQKDIAIQIGVDNIYLSHLRSGTIKNIPTEVIDNLHDEYNINPDFIYKGSANMFDIPGLKYDNFEKFVDSWDLVDHDEKSYLHFTMDEHFYNFLIDVYTQKEATTDVESSEKMTFVLNQALESLKKHYETTPNYKEYVLIPADDVIKIAHDNVKHRKSLNEIINILDIH